ncbi:LPXTG cell wall anchor domain-containing protein [Acidimicrobiia bacterium EGI L10123]|uniref:LPXTG cell wall anchor domain-containing protein n=1 Tax=Salinilacustrithrix flava TaxID=2957203 RepID=UPI003D7C2CEA|nr:LPXTG cell wall anchor domain-containing protein [Acidimicrobiia bacterium EGI L10123]
MGAALVLTTGLPASAQTDPYGGGGGGTTTTTTTPVPGGEPEQPRTVANVSDDDVAPGDPVTVTVPPVFAPGTEVSINLARAQQDAGGVELGSPDANADGSVSDTVTIPATEDGVYFLYVTGVDTDGNPVVAIVAIVVRNGVASASAVEGESFAATAAAAAPVPAAVADVQSNVTPASEAAVVEAVTQSGAGLVLSPESTLNVRTPEGVQAASALPTTGSNDISAQVTIGAALLFAGTGLVLLRRRGGFAK